MINKKKTKIENQIIVESQQNRAKAMHNQINYTKQKKIFLNKKAKIKWKAVF